ncbi:uncharacterized protein HD556DRAFT_1449965 [Suillus plorans]|uniref:DUF6533 domain-containing protein n=1 Tax=Suillus plorans TaxID=116603 RepID=A0A9P7ADR6_9AGAM|nr:uncharacterized protein HD556DRAFT_1449965 [Suillus plorans]KAG1786228.1 hypothetical protein HD556DRAFT_1449965 [Suillus plorans]
MTIVSNDPSWWLTINFNLLNSYWIVAAGVVVVHDWVLTLGQEIELIWRQRWSLMTVLYLIWNTVFCCQYSGKYAAGIADRCSIIVYYVLNGTVVALTVMLGVIMIARLHAMYQGSRTMLMSLIIIFLAVNITCGVIMAIIMKDTVGEELILSGIYMCSSQLEGNYLLLGSMFWMLNTVWEVLALCLSVWVAVKHFRELRRLGPSTGSTIGDCFRVLIQSHFCTYQLFGVSCVQLAFLFPEIPNSDSIGVSILGGTLQICMVIQLFVLGPRLILSVREYHAKLVAYSDAESSMNSIVFQEHGEEI